MNEGQATLRPGIEVLVEGRRKIRVAFMLAPITFGGAERVCMTLLKSINRNKFDVIPILLTQPWENPNSFALELRKAGFDCREIPVALRPFGDHLRVARCWKLVWRQLKANNFDLLHTHGYFADVVGIPVARLAGLRSMSTCHGFISNNWKWRIYNMVDRFALGFASKIVAVSEEIKRDLLRRGLNSKRVQVIANAVSVAEEGRVSRSSRQVTRNGHGISPDEYVVGFLGRLSHEKGLIYLLNACANLARQEVNFKLLIIGEGAEREELQQLSSKLQLGSRVIFAGFQNNIDEWLACMDIFVLPSLTEGTPMALLEAMANGVPVAASAVGGVPQVITHGKTGLLFSPGRADEIAEAIQILYRDRATGQSLAANALSHVRETYGVGKWIERIEAEYQKLSAGGK